jgi:hypothetical protein
VTTAIDPSPPRHLEWRIRIFGIGAIVGLVGMWADQHWMVNVAIAVLAIGVVLRFIDRHPRAAGPEHDELEDSEADDG